VHFDAGLVAVLEARDVRDVILAGLKE